MLRLRAAVPVVLALLVLGVARLYVAEGLDLAATERALGTQAARLGLPALGSLLLNRASALYAERLGGEPTAAAEARGRFLECEFALGRLLLDRGKVSQAKQHFARVKRTCPEAAVAAKAWAAYADAGDGRPGVRKTLLGLMVDAPEDPTPPYLVGRLFLSAGQAAEAARYLKKSVALPGGKTHAAHLALAQALQKTSQGQTAAEAARQALELAATAGEQRDAARLLKRLGASGPDPMPTWLRGLATDHRWGLIGLAAAIVIVFAPTWLGLLARVVPSIVAPLYLVGGAATPQAIRTYEAALRRRPNSPALLRALARAYGRTGVGASRAAELWERLSLLSPNDEVARTHTVRLALETGRQSDAALQACQDAFDDDPYHPDAGAVAAHLARAYRARAAMPPPGALPAIEMAAVAAPGDRDLQLYLSTLYSHYGRHREAASRVEALLVDRPYDEPVRLQYARALIGAGEPYTAFRHLRLLAPSPETTIDLYLAGLAAHNAGRYSESLRILQEVVRRDPSLFDVEERISDASARAGRGRVGAYDLDETVAIHEAHVLHRASHPQHGAVLLLVFRRDFSDALEFPPAFQDHFDGETASLPGSARQLDASSHEEEYFVAYAPPHGAQLAQVLESQGPMNPEGAARAMARVLRALGELHGAGRLHGDLRPSAIWLDDDAGATLVGAGASLVAEASPNPPPGARSPFHAAPEVVQQHHLSVASDLYAAGCVLYELLVGAPPLQGPTHLATLMAHVTIEAEPPSMRAPNIPSALDHLVLRALAKNPSQRPPSAEEFAGELLGMFAEAEAAEPPWTSDAPAAPESLSPDSLLAAEATTGPIDPARWWTAYHDLTPVASGRFSRVYRGAHRPTGEWHAIKQLQLPSAAGGADGLAGPQAAQALVKLFGHEMHVLQTLSETDPPAVGLTGMLQAYRSDEHAPAYAMPLMHETLAARIGREGPLPEAEAIRAFVPLATAVARLHERGFVHRNLSPRSVMLDRRLALIVGGFDHACRLAEREAVLTTELEIQRVSRSPLQVLGDVRFLSPERCRGEEFDERTDIYSLGALLVYLLVGAAPFDRPDALQTMLDHVSSPPPRVEDWRVHVNQTTQEVINRAMAKSPGERFRSVADLLEALTGEAPDPDRHAGPPALRPLRPLGE